jgi:hypothetical protein
MAQEEQVFANGFSFKRSENAPDFVIGRLSMKVDDAIAFLKEHSGRGWCNVNIKQARTGNYYVSLDTFKPGERETSPGLATPTPESAPGEDNLPF